MKFAVLGDIHHSVESSHALALLHGKGYAGEERDIRKYLQFQDNCVADILQQVKGDRSIDFVIQLGDFVQGDCDNEQSCAREFEYSLNILTGINRELHICRGNHDNPQHFVSIAKKRLNVPDSAAGYNSYSFERDNSLFVILDYQEIVEKRERREWLSGLLNGSAGYEHVFVFSHDPVYPVSRSFFVNKQFADILRDLFKNVPVDCHFAGHTHEQLISTHAPGAKRYLQLVSAPLGRDKLSDAVALNRTRKLILPDDGVFIDGFLENSLPGWYLITVEQQKVTAQFRSLAKHGKLASVAWSGRGADYEYKRSEKLQDIQDKKTVFDPGKIVSARISAVIYDYKKLQMLPVSLNGHRVGGFPGSGYLCSLEIAKDKLPYLQHQNTVTIDNPGGEELTVISLHLECETSSGEKCYSNVSQKIYSTGCRYDGLGAEIQHINSTESIKEVLTFI